MIITVTLAQGARRMTRKKVLVKQLAAIEDFGSIEILCSDKTGTLTEGEIVLDRHVDIQGEDDENVLRLRLPEQLLRGRHQEPARRRDPEARAAVHRASTRRWTRSRSTSHRKRLSVVVRHGGRAPAHHQGRGRRASSPSARPSSVDGSPQPFDDDPAGPGGGDLPEAERRRLPHARSRRADGGQRRPSTRPTAERDMTLVGFAAFLDPPKEGVPRRARGAERRTASPWS